MILFFTSLQMVCLDKIDNYVEIVLISCMFAHTLIAVNMIQNTLVQT